MPLTLDQIVEEVRRWPAEQVTELVDRLSSALHNQNPPVEEAWKQETRRRLAEIEAGQVQGIPGEQVAEDIRRSIGR